MYGEKQAGSALQYRKFYHLFFCKFKEKRKKNIFFFPKTEKNGKLTILMTSLIFSNIIFEVLFFPLCVWFVFFF